MSAGSLCGWQGLSVPSWARYSWESFVFLSRHPACPGSADTMGRSRGRVSALCQAALRKQTDGHAMDQGLSLEQACLWPLPCVYFSYLSFIFFGTLIQDVYIFPCLTGVLFLLISEVFVRPQPNQNLPPFLSEIHCMLCCFWIVCLFIYFFDTNPYWTWQLPISSPFHTSFLILLMVPHGKAFKCDVHTLVHFSLHFFSFRNYSQISLPRLMYRNKVPLPF